MVIENCIQESIDFFHLDALSAAVPLKIDVDLQFTLLASTLYRLLARRIGHGHERTKARQLFDRFVRTTATVRILGDAIDVRLGRRAHNPLRIGAGFAVGETVVPWLENRKLRILIGYDKHSARQPTPDPEPLPGESSRTPRPKCHIPTPSWECRLVRA